LVPPKRAPPKPPSEQNSNTPNEKKQTPTLPPKSGRITLTPEELATQPSQTDKTGY
jgi:hypothetical protein